MSADPAPSAARSATVTVEVAQAADVPALQAVARASWWATYGDYLSPGFIEDFLARAYSPARLSVQLQDPQSCFLIAKNNDTLIGFGQVGPSLPRRDPAPVAPADLHRLYLLPAWQRQGIGAKLLGELEAWLRQRNYVCYGAYVHQRNEPAQRFYLRQGFIRKPACDVQDEWYLVKQFSMAT